MLQAEEIFLFKFMSFSAKQRIKHKKHKNLIQSYSHNFLVYALM